MPEETTPHEGTPSTSIDWDSPDNPYLKRYTDTQSAYTQNQQRLRELERYESDPDAYIELGKQRGWVETDPPAEPDPGIDPMLAQTQAELAELKAWQAEVKTQMQAEQRSAGMELFHQDLDEWADEAGVKLSPADHNAIYGVLMQADDPTQEHYAKAAFEAHVAHKNTEREQLEAEIREQLKRPRVPHVPGGNGAADTGTPDWSGMSRTDIDKYMAERAMSG